MILSRILEVNDPLAPHLAGLAHSWLFGSSCVKGINDTYSIAVNFVPILSPNNMLYIM